MISEHPHAVSSEVENWSRISLLAAGGGRATASAVTDDELAARGLPPIAYVDNTFDPSGTAHTVLAIVRGEVGYHGVHTDRCADEMNKAAGVSEAQVLAMMTGSMLGWDVLGAHPWTWRQHVRQVSRARIVPSSPPPAMAAAATPPTNDSKELNR